MTIKLAILCTHPIQYYAPLFKLLSKEKSIQLKVFYSLGIEQNMIDKGFGKTINWDIPLLTGYDYEFLKNRAKNKGSDHFNGIKNPSIIAKIENFDPSILLVYGWAYHSHLKAIRYFYKKVPIWFKGDSTLLNQKTIWKLLLRKLFLSLVYRHIDKAIYVGQQNKAYYKAYGLKKSQLIFVPHAVDNDRFAEDRSSEVKILRETLALKAEDILILFAGKFENIKNPHLLLNAFGAIEADNVHLLFVGNGILEESLKFDVASNRLKCNSNKVHFLPFQNQSQMPVIYQACELFCLPSLSETWGLSVNEAMAAGKAVLVSDQVGCAIDLVQNDLNGLIFQSNNLTSLIAALNVLTIDIAKLKLMGIKSKMIINQWSFNAQLETLMAHISG